MLEFFAEYGMFLAKAVTLVVALLVVVGSIASMSQRPRGQESGSIEVKNINDRFEAMHDALRASVLSEADAKLLEKDKKAKEKEKLKLEKKAAKATRKESKKAAGNASATAEADRKKRLYVLNFDGDVKASAVESLREEISTVLTMADAQDEVVLRLESPGGMVHSYGLAASQLARIKSKELPLTICVDKVAASGGYMMACIGDKILAAPFAVMGSIGVVAQLPNFHRLLKKNDVDFELFTAGKYKRTVTMFGENTAEGREKFTDELEDTHELFKEFVSEHRPSVDIDKVATGEVWYGRRALEEKLIDSVMTSDEYLQQQAESCDVYEISFKEKKSIQEKLGMAAANAADLVLLRWWQRLNNRRYL